MNTRPWFTAAVVACLASIGTAAAAQERGQDAHRTDGQNWSDNNRNQSDRARFSDQDRQNSRDWFNQHRDRAPAGLRSRDRFSADLEIQMRPGTMLDARVRRQSHSMPRDLAHRLGAPPRGTHYMIVGGYIALIDRQNRVLDVILLQDQRWRGR